jgi:hypothetical protein
MGFLKYTLSLFLVLQLTLLLGQVPTEELENQLESLAEGNQENETDLIQLAENLQLLRQNPVKVNFATAEELQQIPYLDVFQIANLLRYRQETGLLYGSFELKVIKGFDENTIAQIMPYLSFATQRTRPQIKPENLYRYSRHHVLARSIVDLQKRQGFRAESSNPYLGPPGNHYLRYRARYKNLLSAGFSAQQDAGEPWGGPGQTSWVDFLSGHVALSNYGNLKTLIVGDFQAEFGQGLALWSSLAFGKGAQTTNIRRFGRGFTPFTGAEENRFMRGIATTWQWKNWEWSAFYSRNKIDANPSQLDTNLQALNVSSLPTTGLHRSATELAQKDQNALQSTGGNISYTYRQLKVGATAVHYNLALPLEPGRQLYQKFRFSGNRLTNSSLHFNYLFLDLNLFGEVAFDAAGNSAQTIGLQSQPADALQATLLVRNLDKRYQFLYNAPFAESGANGEQGAYLGWQWQLNAQWQWRTYLDVYRFTWPRFRTDAPSRGSDWLSQLNWQGSRWLSGYLRWRQERRQINSTLETTLPGLTWEQRGSLRLHLVYTLQNQWRLSSRYEYSAYSRAGESENGSVLFQDVRYTFKNAPLQLTARYALINTASFNTRIYAYENDLTYAFSIPPYYGEAQRFYLLADYDLSAQLTLQAKYARTHFLDRNQISSGNQAIAGPTNSEIRLQLRWQF